jgi:4'-phosphopantetheinyl transferase
MALFAVAKDRAVGIDIEYCRPFPGMMDLARRFFSSSEYATMRSLAPAMQISYFYTVWTCKEACLKATGEGLGGLDRLDISIPQNGRAVSLAHGIGEGTSGRWALKRLELPAGYAAALVVEGEDWDLVEISNARVTLGGYQGQAVLVR